MAAAPSTLLAVQLQTPRPRQRRVTRQVAIFASHDAKYAPYDVRPAFIVAQRQAGTPRAAALEAPLALEERTQGSTDWAESMGQGQAVVVVRQLLSAYGAALDAHPILTKALTSFLGFAIGDALAQGITGVGFDSFRCLRLSLYGLCLDGPVGHAWYRLLDRSLCPEDPTSTQAVLAKTAADQLLWAPTMTVVFFAFLKLLEGRPEQIGPTIQDLLFRTVLANYVLWPAAHFVSFRYVPSEFRILYNNAVALAWTAYLSWACGGAAEDTASAAGGASAPLGLTQSGDRLTGSHCVHKLQQMLQQQHQEQGWAVGCAGAKQQALALERILAAWGWQGLPGGEAASQLLQQNLGGKLHSVAQQLFSVPIHTMPHKF